MSPVAILPAQLDQGAVAKYPPVDGDGLHNGVHDAQHLHDAHLHDAPDATTDTVAGVATAQDIGPRRPSPWHDLAHSLSTTSIPSRSPSISTTPPYTPSPALSTSQALREWEARLALPMPSVSRHALVPPESQSPPRSEGSPSPLSHPVLVPKLVPERDKEGHIEYKLKLLDPSPDRFERLVTQMMWRLKQGRNEAIYELGLADDGTVVGLSRADMDASLRTLELMASDVGATVIVLKEIVLAAPTFPQRGSARNDSPAGWVVPTIPHDEDQNIQKKKKKNKSWSRARRRDAAKVGQGPVERDTLPSAEKQIVFDLPEDEDESEEEIVLGDRDDRDRRRAVSVDSTLSKSDEDVPPFDLDMGDSPERERGSPAPPKPLSAKARKALLRREARRLDLLRGDGTSSISINPHAPSRPSSLRLTSPAPPPLTLPDNALDTDNGEADGAFIQDLLVTPLDSLSLSFAHVQRVGDVKKSLADMDEGGPEEPGGAGDSGEPRQLAIRHGHEAPVPVALDATAGEKICVEALVVRKVVHEEEDGWWGGQDDGWGFTPDQDGEGEGDGGGEGEEAEVEVDEEDGWGF